MRNLAIHIVITPHCLASSFILPLEMFSAAHEKANTYQQTAGQHRLTTRFIAENEAVTSHFLLPFRADKASDKDSFEAPDIILIPSLWGHPLKIAKSQTAICKYLNHFCQKGIPVCTVGTGSSLLAVSGALDERVATTHWYYFNIMEKHFPNTLWKRSHRVTQSRNIFCAGSINSVADLSIHIIESLYNKDVANTVANQFSPEARKPLQDQLFSEQQASKHQDELIVEAQSAIQEALSLPLQSSNLANQLGISVRSLQRRFKQATGQSLTEYQQSLRIEGAKSLLQDSNASVEDIAQIIGFSDSSHLSRIFKRHTQITPKNYRNNVRSKLFSPTEISQQK